MSASSSLPRFIDIAVNLTDPMFKGEYRGKKAHESDVDAVLERAKKAGVVAQIITGDSAEAVREGLEMCAKGESTLAQAKVTSLFSSADSFRSIS